MVLKRLSCNGEHIILMKAHGRIVMVIGAILSGVHVSVTVEESVSLSSGVALFLLYLIYKWGKYADSDGQSRPASAITRLCFKHVRASSWHNSDVRQFLDAMLCHFFAMVGAPALMLLFSQT